MTSPRGRRRIALAAAAPLLATALAACGGDDEPAVCASLEDLRSSVQSLRSASIGDGAIETIRTSVADMRTAVTQIKVDAEGDFETELDAVSSSLSVASDAVTAAVADPSAAAVAQVAASVEAVTDAGRGLVSAVEDSC